MQSSRSERAYPFERYLASVVQIAFDIQAFPRCRGPRGTPAYVCVPQRPCIRACEATSACQSLALPLALKLRDAWLEASRRHAVSVSPLYVSVKVAVNRKSPPGTAGSLMLLESV